MTTQAIPVSEFKAHCLDLIRQVEQQGATLDLTRHGKVVARLVPTLAANEETHPWQRLRGRGVLDASPEESVMTDEDFDACRPDRK